MKTDGVLLTCPECGYRYIQQSDAREDGIEVLCRHDDSKMLDSAELSEQVQGGRWAIEVLVYEVDAAGDEIKVERVYTPMLAVDNRDEALAVGRVVGSFIPHEFDMHVEVGKVSPQYPRRSILDLKGAKGDG